MAINRPFKNGLMLKGAYTLSKAKNEVDDDGWSQLTWQRAEPAEPQLRARRLRPPADVPHGVRLRVAVQDVHGKDIAHLILGDWQINGIYSAVSGTPFTVTANGTQLNMPGTRRRQTSPAITR